MSMYICSFINISIGFFMISPNNHKVFKYCGYLRLSIGLVWVFIGMVFCWSSEMKLLKNTYSNKLYLLY